jgi:hypothetical protein
MKKAVFWDVVLTNVTEERIASILRVHGKIKKQSACTCSHCPFAIGFSYFSFFPEDGGDTFLLNVG